MTEDGKKDKVVKKDTESITKQDNVTEEENAEEISIPKNSIVLAADDDDEYLVWVRDW